MRITLDLVRHTLRETLGRESFVASFIATVVESSTVPTAGISSDGALSYNPAFTARHITGGEDLFCLLMHEVMHPMFGHFVHADGQLENIAADTVINACVSQLYHDASGGGSLFKKVYEPRGLEGLLRPFSRMRDSRYCRLYDAFYGYGASSMRLSTGEVIQSLKVLTPVEESRGVLLLGSHGNAGGMGNGGNTGEFTAETLSNMAEDLRKSMQSQHSRRYGCGEAMHRLLMEVIKTHISVRKVLLQRFTTKRKVDRFKESVHRPAICVSPVPLNPSKRDMVLLAAEIPLFYYHNRMRRMAAKERGLALYLDVSGSVNEHLPEIIGLLSGMQAELSSIFLFSNEAVEVPFNALLRGEIHTTHGTDFDCVADSILNRGFDKAVVITDGYASLDGGKQAELKRRGLQTLTILFGGKTDCAEFATFGDVVALEDVTE